jgi:hypothetical protein
MTREEFQRIVATEPQVRGVVERAGRAGSKASTTRQFAFVAEAAAVALMFPIARYVLVNIGLPWLSELKRYSELQRQKVHAWIDECFLAEGLDPYVAEAASNAFCQELEQTTAADARAAWERLADLMRKEST